MNDSTDSTDATEYNERYTCNLCNRQFTNRKTYWYHKSKSKTPCITKQECEELVEQVHSKDSSINYLKEKAEQTNQELERLTNENKGLKRVLAEQTMLNDVKKRKINVDVDTFMSYLHKYDFYDVFEEIFKENVVCYETVHKFIAITTSRRNVSEDKKNQLDFKQNFACIQCSKRTLYLEIDYIKPLYQGGSNSFENLQGLCGTCHAEKTIRDSIIFYDNIQQTCHQLFYEK